MPSVTHDYGHFTIEFIPFIATYTGGILQLQEHQQAEWYTTEELTTLDWAPADVPVLNAFLSTL